MIRMSMRITFVAFAVLIAAIFVGDRIAAQGVGHQLQVVRADFIEVSETSSAVQYEGLIEVVNTGSTDFDGVSRIDYRIDDGDPILVYVLTGLKSGESQKVTFRFELEPGERRVSVSVGDSVLETDIQVTAADLNVGIVSDRVLVGGIVELDVLVSNLGGRTAKSVAVKGNWAGLIQERSGDAESVAEIDMLEPGTTQEVKLHFHVGPGSYRFGVSVSAATVETSTDDNFVIAAIDAEFVELSVEIVSMASVRWVNGERALMAFEVAVSNHGVDATDGVEVGFVCADQACFGIGSTGSIAAAETAVSMFEVWMPIGTVSGALYAGANDDGFRWGDGNVVASLIDVPESPPFEWSIAAVSTQPEIRYWRDGSANVDFELAWRNTGSELVSGVVGITARCYQSETLIDDCGGDFEIDLGPDIDSDLILKTIRMPQGETEVVFAQAGEIVLFSASATVPERILGVKRSIWECFSDTSNLNADTPFDDGVGCGGWRNDYVTKFPSTRPIRVWISGDEDYQRIFEQVLEDLASQINIEFETVGLARRADVLAYLGLPREGTELDGLDCNHAAGCASFEISPDGVIEIGRLVVWPPANALDAVGHEHLIYTVSLHELIHVVTGMLHRHDDHTSVMSYDALDYRTLGENDVGLISIAMHPLVEPGMRFDEILDLVVFEDELVDPPEDEAVSVRTTLRQAHAKLMDSGAAHYEIMGGWAECNSEFGWSDYIFGSPRPRAPQLIRFKNDARDYYIIRSPKSPLPIQFWKQVARTLAARRKCRNPPRVEFPRTPSPTR